MKYSEALHHIDSLTTTVTGSELKLLSTLGSDEFVPAIVLGLYFSRLDDTCLSVNGASRTHPQLYAIADVVNFRPLAA